MGDTGAKRTATGRGVPAGGANNGRARNRAIRDIYTQAVNKVRERPFSAFSTRATHVSIPLDPKRRT